MRIRLPVFRANPFTSMTTAANACGMARGAQTRVRSSLVGMARYESSAMNAETCRIIKKESFW
jgi:hypothetical protein